MRREEHRLEYGDRPIPPSELAPYLDDLARLNAWSGGYRLTVRALRRVLAREAATGGREAAPGPLRVVDVGGSRGELAVRIARDARKRGTAVTVIVVDRDEASLVLGARVAKDCPEVRWVQAEATALPLRPGSIDAAVTSLTLHHLAPEAVVRALAGMRAAARAGVVVNDLIRDRLQLVLCWLATRLFARHPYARHDGPLSVRRAYSARELADLAARAGFRDFTVRHYRGLARLIGVGR